MIDEAVAAFRQVFGGAPAVCGVGPGRVELLGNHTDYNGGCVLTAAIDRRVVVAGRCVTGYRSRVHSVYLGQTAEFQAQSPAHDPAFPWADYVQGVAAVLSESGLVVPAFEAVITSDLPTASGLSSSAALEAATAQLIAGLTEFEPDRLELARLLQKAENEFVGVRCGILDQFSSIFGRADQVIYLDCGSLQHELLPLGEAGRAGPAIVLCDAQAPRSLAAGQYNQRRAECEQAASLLAVALGRPVERLCDVRLPEFEALAAALPDPVDRRARHVIGENDRVDRARQSLRTGRFGEVGKLLVESHLSSRVNFENSTDGLDLLQDLAVRQPGCLGSRLCGGGWGGNTVNLVAPQAVDEFAAAIVAGYRSVTGNTPPIHICRAADGAQTVRL